MKVVYAELRKLAAAKLRRERGPQTLQPTALVHEAWLRLGGDAQANWNGRRHFFGAAAEAMRQILIERARRRRAKRHGGDWIRERSEELDRLVLETSDAQILAINDALIRLAEVDSEKAELVKLRYFVGYSLKEAGSLLGIAEPTAKRWWSFARAWLAREIQRQQRCGR